MSIHQLKDGRWIVQWPNPSPPPRLLREYFGRGPSSRLRAEQRDKELSLKETRPRKSSYDHLFLFYELAAEYISTRQLAETTKKHMTIVLRSNILPIIGKLPALKISFDTISNYVSIRRQKIKSVSVRREVVYIKTVMSWAAKQNPPLLAYNPIRDYPLPKDDDSDILSPPTPQEIADILKHASPHLYRAIKIAYYTGLRPGKIELLRIKWDAVLWDRNVIRVLSAKKGGPVLRDIPIHPEFLGLLKTWWEEDAKTENGPIIHYAGSGIMDNVLYSWKMAKKRAGITRRLPFYFLRHDFVTTALESGVDIKTLAEIVGSSPETLRRHYQHVSGEAKVHAIEMIRGGNTAGNTGNNLS
jgi:integrase